jgi:hypothetical protein
MKNAKEKAEELIRKYYTWGINKEGQTLSWLEAKQCALIAIDEILNLMIKEFKWDVKHNGNIEYWEEVKTEIENYNA